MLFHSLFHVHIRLQLLISVFFFFFFCCYPRVVDLCSVWNVLFDLYIFFCFGTDGMKPDGHLESHTVIDMRSVMRTKPSVNPGNLSVKFVLKTLSTGVILLGHLLLKKPSST